MALTTKPDVELVRNTWTNLCTAASITVGLPLSIINKGNSPVIIAISSAAPTDLRGTPLYVGDHTSALTVPTGTVGCWAYSPDDEGVLSVQNGLDATSDDSEASEAHVGQVGGHLFAVSVAFARPADANPIAALDVVGNTGAAALLTFTNAARVAGGAGYVAKARLMTDQSTNIARFRLHLYHTAPTAIADNSPMTLLWANVNKRVGYIDFAACKTEGTGSTAAGSINTSDHPAFVCASGSRDLYGILEALDGFTPAISQNFGIELTVEQY